MADRAKKLVRNTVHMLQFGGKKMPTKKLEFLPAKDAEGTTIDFVFVSGFGEDEKKAWQAGNGVFWPASLLPSSIPNARVLWLGLGQEEIFEDSVKRVCGDLHDCRRNDNSTNNTIVFVAHSLGGLVCAEIIAQGGTSIRGGSARQIADSVRGIAFFGTPFQGSTMELGEIVKKIMDLYQVTTRDLVEKSLELKNSFPTALGERKNTKKEVRVISFAERRLTDGFKLVDENAATIPGHGSVLRRYNNHYDIGIFEEEDDDDYQDMIPKLQELVAIPEKEKKPDAGITVHGNNAMGPMSGGQHYGNRAPLTYGGIQTQNNYTRGDEAGNEGEAGKNKRSHGSGGDSARK